MRYFSVFSGVGGFELGIEQAYEDLRSAGANEKEVGLEGHLFDASSERSREPATCVGFSEIDKYASAVLKYRFPNVTNYGDITKIDWAAVPDFDLLVGGSPCQDLSVAGRRNGLQGKRSGLFYEYIRCLKERQPRYFIWENVKGALSSNQGWDFAEVVSAFSEAGYSLWWQVLNAKDFGVPQNRERVFIVGTRNGSPREILFERGDEQESLKANDGGGEAVIHDQNIDGKIYSYAYSPPLRSASTIWNKFVQRPRVARTIRVGGAKSPHGSKQNWDSYEVGGRIRRLTPRECERLMSWPDDWTQFGAVECYGGGQHTQKHIRSFSEDLCVVEISDSQRYKMCGNGVVSAVVREVVKAHIL